MPLTKLSIPAQEWKQRLEKKKKCRGKKEAIRKESVCDLLTELSNHRFFILISCLCYHSCSSSFHVFVCFNFFTGAHSDEAVSEHVCATGIASVIEADIY